MNGPHNGFKVQGHITNVVKRAMSESDKPRLLYISTDTTEVATKGRPSEK
jgi:hypothetical protein